MMTDIIMCDDQSCHMKKDCYRYRAIPNEYRQSYFMQSPRKHKICEEFIEFNTDTYRISQEDNCLPIESAN